MNKNTLTRRDIQELIHQYHATKPRHLLPYIPHTQINLKGFNLTKLDFRGLKRQDLDIFDFTNTDISGVHLDKESFDFFLYYIRKQLVHFNSLNLSGADLSPILCHNPAQGLKYHKIFNLSDLNLENTDFTNSTLTSTLFVNTNIQNCNFINCKDIFPEQFVSAKNYRSAIFSTDYDDDALFKTHIQKLHDNLVGVRL